MATNVKIQDIVGGLKATPVGTDTLEIQETANGDSYYVTVAGVLGVAHISTIVEKTIGSGKDFETLVDALTWLNSVVFTATGGVTFILDDGIHTLKSILGITGFWGSFGITSGVIIFRSASWDKTLCKIAIDSTEPDAALFTCFLVKNASLWFQSITVDLDADGNSVLAAKTEFIYYDEKATGVFSNFDIFGCKNFCSIYRNSWVELAGSCVIDGCTSNAITIRRSSSLQTNGATFQNNGEAISVVENSKAVIYSGNTFTGNTTDYRYPLNEIQYDGSYIADNEATLFHKAKANYQNGTAYTITAADNAADIVFDNAAAIAVTLPDTLDINFRCTISQVGAGVPTVTRSGTDTINGGAGGVTPSAQWKGIHLAQYAAGTWLARV